MSERERFEKWWDTIPIRGSYEDPWPIEEIAELAWCAALEGATPLTGYEATIRTDGRHSLDVYPSGAVAGAVQRPADGDRE